MLLKKGVKLLEETEGDGEEVERQKVYLLGIRIRLNQGELIDLSKGGTSRVYDEHLKYQDDGYLESRMRIDRENLVSGIFYAVQGMKIGGYRKVKIAPHLAYREEGIPGIIPPNAILIAEIKVIQALD